MNDAASLLEQASGVLREATAYSNRAACWIARAALEARVDVLLNERKRNAPEASMRSKLTVLQVAYEDAPVIALRAEYAWSRLSLACHHHAFELTPAAPEVQHLIEVVKTL